jgi:hypothetical protein
LEDLTDRLPPVKFPDETVLGRPEAMELNRDGILDDEPALASEHLFEDANVLPQLRPKLPDV